MIVPRHHKVNNVGTPGPVFYLLVSFLSYNHSLGVVDWGSIVIYMSCCLLYFYDCYARL